MEHRVRHDRKESVPVFIHAVEERALDLLVRPIGESGGSQVRRADGADVGIEGVEIGEHFHAGEPPRHVELSGLSPRRVTISAGRDVLHDVRAPGDVIGLGFVDVVIVVVPASGHEQWASENGKAELPNNEIDTHRSCSFRFRTTPPYRGQSLVHLGILPRRKWAPPPRLQQGSLS